MLIKQKNWFSVDSLSFSFSSNKLILPRTFIRLWWFDQITSFSFLAKFFITTAALASPSCNSFSMSGQKLTKLSIYKQNCAAYDVVFASKHLFMYLPFFFLLDSSRTIYYWLWEDLMQTIVFNVFLRSFPHCKHNINFTQPKQKIVTYFILWL